MLADKPLLSEALDLVAKLVGQWPQREVGQDYVGALAVVLTDYPRSIVQRCCDPRQGVARETKFMPTVADLVTWCDRAVAPLLAIVQREDREIALQAEMAQRRIEDRTERETMAQLRARLGPTFGLRKLDEPKPQEDPDATGQE